MNDIIRSSFLEVANYQQQELIRQADRSRLLAQVPGRQSPRIVRFVRLNIGSMIISMGRRIEGCSARAQAEEINASPALNLAR